MSTPAKQLQQLAMAYGVQTAYRDVHGRRQQASTETLLRVLATLGAPVEQMDDVPDALRHRQQQLTGRVIEPVVLAWDGILDEVVIRLPHGPTPDSAHFHCELENGETIGWTSEPSGSTQHEHRPSEQELVFKPKSRTHLPLGYHELHVEVSGQRGEALLISAPTKAYTPPPGNKSKWGLFAPVYALHSSESWGGGNLADLETLWDWTTRQGGTVVATLPLLAAYLDDPCDFSPYTPASRLFWNEFYIDARRVEELQNSTSAQQLLAAPEFQSELKSLRSESLVDYRRQMRLQRRLLELLSRSCFEQNSERRAELERYIQARPEVESYAAFRATVERQQKLWPSWPEPLRTGQLGPDDYDEDARRYHMYVQWIIEQQIGRLNAESRQSGGGLYLDLPLGVHGAGFDTWQEQDAFALKAAGGAPPDAFFTKGQNWGFAPLHPERLRQQQYRHFIAVLRNHFRHSEMLRIDHVMQLHRLYWIPQGMDAKEGAYIRYPADELYAILCLESQRHDCVVVGENLGTVPSYVNDAMKRHEFRQMYVAQYENNSRTQKALPTIPRRCVASANTHDMANFAAYWESSDLDLLFSLGLFDEEGIQQEHADRQTKRQALVEFLRAQGLLAKDEQPECAAVLDALNHWLAQSNAELMLVNLEDLWLETEPQNTPGTGFERPNWRRKMRYSLEEITNAPELAQRLQRLSQLRGQKANVPS